MQLNDVITIFGVHLQCCYGEKIHKISLHGLYCPNRGATVAVRFVTLLLFLISSSNFGTNYTKNKKIRQARRYLAYFQAYTNTYDEVAILKQLYQQTLNQANIVGLCVDKRPDCVFQPVLDLLVEYQ